MRRRKGAGKTLDLSAIYDLLCQRAEMAIEKYDPCHIREGRCRRDEFCCDGCRHLGQAGCTVKALACRVWLCIEAENDPRNAQCKRILREIAAVADQLKINGYRCSKEENLLRKAQEPIPDVFVQKEWPQWFLSYFIQPLPYPEMIE